MTAPTTTKTLHRVSYGETGSIGDRPLYVWEFMRTCASETDPERHHWLSYIDAQYFEDNRHFYEEIVGWEWELSRGDNPRYTIYALLGCPVMACLWRVVLPVSGPYEHERFGEMRYV